MTELACLHTSQLGADARAELRSLLDACFDDFNDDAWDHALGGMHALIRVDGVLVGHASVVQRRLLHAGRALRCGYVEAVAVASAERGRGHGAALMGVLGTLIADSYEIGGLSSSDAGRGVYERTGWQAWQGETYALTPSGVVRTMPDDDSVMVLPCSVELDLRGTLTCDWRDGSPW